MEPRDDAAGAAPLTADAQTTFNRFPATPRAARPRARGKAKMTGDAMAVLEQVRRGLRAADPADPAFALVYAEMKRIAERMMRRQGPEHTLQATALVHEAYVRLCDREIEVEGLPQFRALVARTIRSVLVDHARGKGRRKRTARGARLPLDGLLDELCERARDPVALDDALDRLEEIDPVGVRLVELRFFEGRSMTEVARMLGIPLRTLERDWQTVRAWLSMELEA